MNENDWEKLELLEAFYNAIPQMNTAWLDYFTRDNNQNINLLLSGKRTVTRDRLPGYALNETLGMFREFDWLP